MWIKPDIDRASERLSLLCKVVLLVALGVIGVRAAVRLEDWYDTLFYHLPFAALRGGIKIPYEMSDQFQTWYEGFPPLAYWVQGFFWRISGTANATGVVNYLAFLTFLVYCHRALRANFWLVGLIALSAPLVVIHATTSYVDLFGNSFLAIGLSSCLYLHLFPEKRTRAVLIGGLLGLVAAAWTKYFMVPAVAFGFLGYGALLLRKDFEPSPGRRRMAAMIFAAAALASAPYLKNWVLYANPFWPGRLPVFGGYFPYMIDSDALGAALNRPTGFEKASKLTLFVRSLFEIGVPSVYSGRPRWNLDQGWVPPEAMMAFRMGGFWVGGVVLYLLGSFGMLIAFGRKVGVAAVLFFIALLLGVAQIPQSHELRYYLFIPLCWAAAIGMLYPTLKSKAPKTALLGLALTLSSFLYMVSENRTHYSIKFLNLADAAYRYGSTQWWPKFRKEEVYCAVGMDPAAITLTGPTLSEFRIVDRSLTNLCPRGSIIMTHSGITDVRGDLDSVTIYKSIRFDERASEMVEKKEFYGALAFAKRGIEVNPNNAEIHNTLCVIYMGLGRYRDGIKACNRAIELKPDFALARSNLLWLQVKVAEVGR